MYELDIPAQLVQDEREPFCSMHYHHGLHFHAIEPVNGVKSFRTVFTS